MSRATTPSAFEDAAPGDNPARRSVRVFAGVLLVFRGMAPQNNAAR